MNSEQEVPKWGGGHAPAMFRQGLSELRAAMYAGSNIAQPTETGMFGTKTQSEIANERQGDLMETPIADQGIIDARLDQHDAKHGREDRFHEPERD